MSDMCFVCDKEMTSYVPYSDGSGFRVECKEHGSYTNQIKLLKDMVASLTEEKEALRKELLEQAADYENRLVDARKYQQEAIKRIEELEEEVIDLGYHIQDLNDR